MVPICCLGTFANCLVLYVSIWLNIIIHIIFNLNKKCIVTYVLNTVEMHEASYVLAPVPAAQCL